MQDIETSYYGTDDYRAVLSRRQVLAGYREEFAYITISRHSQQALKEMGREAELIPPGIDLDNFRQLGTPRSEDTILALGRTSHLKNFPLTVAAWERLDPRPPLKLFGVEPEAADGLDAEYVYKPSDAEVNELFNEAAVFVQTSRHEGFCLPPLEAMAAGTPVVCTDAHGNRDFCVHGENCLMVEARSGGRRRRDRARARRRRAARKLVEGGLATVGEYAWERRIDQMEEFFAAVADQEAPAPSGARARAARRPCVRPPPSCCAARAAGPTAPSPSPPRRATSARCARARSRARSAAGSSRCATASCTCCTTRRTSWRRRPPASSASQRRCAPTAGTGSASSACPRTRTRATGSRSTWR